MPPPLRAPWAPTSTRCFLFGHGLTFLLDETLLLADVEHVTLQGDSAQTSSQQNEPACLCRERDAHACCAPQALVLRASMVSPAGVGKLDLPTAPAGPAAVITEKRGGT